MYTLQLGVFMYRLSIIDLPVVFKEYFTKRSEIHNYPTRHVNDLMWHIIRNPFPIMLLEQVVLFFGAHYQKHWKNQKQLDISEISLNKNVQNYD